MRRKITTSLFCFLSYIVAIQSVQRYEVTSIKTENHHLIPTDINNDGKVCGVFGGGYGFFGSPPLIFVWDSTDEEFNFLNVSYETFPSINSSGQVAFSSVESGWFYNSTVGYVWDPFSGLKKLQSPQSWNEVYVKNINNNGDVLVTSRLSKSCKCNPQASLIVSNAHTLYPYDFSILQQGQKLNNQSQVLGTSYQKADFKQIPTPIIINLSTHEAVTLPFETASFGFDINDLGQVVGEFYDTLAGKWRGFLWDQEKGVTVFQNFFPKKLNNTGIIIGLDQAEKPAIYEDGQVTSFNSLLVQEGAHVNEIQTIYAINDRGQMVGEGLINGVFSGFFLNPLPAQPEIALPDSPVIEEELPPIIVIEDETPPVIVEEENLPVIIVEDSPADLDPIDQPYEDEEDEEDEDEEDEDEETEEDDNSQENEFVFIELDEFDETPSEEEESVTNQSEELPYNFDEEDYYPSNLLSDRRPPGHSEDNNEKSE